jgi:hypothetical protein
VRWAAAANRVILLLAFVSCLAVSQPAAGQPPDTGRLVMHKAADAPLFSVRPFAMGVEQTFAATTTFDGVFGRSREPFFGAGVQVLVQGRYYAEIGVSRFKGTGERAFRVADETFRLGLPLTVTVRPIEVTGGYRFHQLGSHVVPYAGGGLGWYAYTETSPSSDPEENLDLRHRGAVLTGGAEIRVHTWVHIGVDAQYTHVPGILGAGGISKVAAEDDLGGIAARIKLIVGR